MLSAPTPTTENNSQVVPAILAPAGNRDTFLAALAAGADAIYCGLKQYSARMAAKNFTIETLKPLVDLAHDQSVEVYIALNSLIKPQELDAALSIIDQLQQTIQPEALIIQDLALVKLARQAGFTGQLHLSTLANASFPAGLQPIHASLGIDRVVIPRELSIDEVKPMAEACPSGLDLEIFVHGALCYAVSGRCYWSSYLGGKSGLRGRCVQPCRRKFSQKENRNRFFACRDLSLDVLVKVIRSIKKVKAWKIEGRKKGPHYVYYTVSAYRMLRDEGIDAKIRRDAVQLLERSLGRPGTHYHFLPQHPHNPIDLKSRTGSGLMIGSTQGPARRPYVRLREPLFKRDVIRVGYEDEPWHQQVQVNRSVPSKGQFNLRIKDGKPPPKGTPVFLTDRREPALMEMINSLEKKLADPMAATHGQPMIQAKLPQPATKWGNKRESTIYASLPNETLSPGTGIWLFSINVSKLSDRSLKNLWFWLPPTIWPQTEDKIRDHIETVLSHGARQFVLNAPWQTALFPETTQKSKKLALWAGPFCNLANPLAFETLVDLGFRGAIVSPELDKAACLDLPRRSPLPLGIVVSGNWPLCLSRIVSDELAVGQNFLSPKRESAWVTPHDDMYWIYPNWPIDLTDQRALLHQAGYRLLIHMNDPPPKGIQLKKRAGWWNWSIGLK